MRVVTFGDEIGRAHVNEEPGKDREHGAERAFGDRDRYGRENTEHGCRGCNREPRERATTISFSSLNVLATEGNADRTDAVGDLVNENGGSHERSHFNRHLKRKPDGDTVEEAVRDKTADTEPAAVRMHMHISHGVMRFAVRCMKEKQTVDEKICKEPERHVKRDRPRLAESFGKLECLGYKIEERDSDDGTRAEPEHKVELIAKTERQKPASERGNECGDGDEGQHDHLLVQPLVVALENKSPLTTLCGIAPIYRHATVERRLFSIDT